MELNAILSYLKSNYSGEEFKEFTKKIVNSKSEVIGVKTDVIKSLAKSIVETNSKQFLDYKDVTFYEQKLLYGFVLAYSKLKLQEFEKYFNFYLSIIDSWAIVDSPICAMKIIKNNKDYFFEKLVNNLNHKNPFAVRFSVVAFFKFYLTDNYVDKVIEIYKTLKSEHYYINIGLSWGICEILIKHFDKGVNLLQTKQLSAIVQNKAIQKACESFRITEQQKQFLKTLKV